MDGFNNRRNHVLDKLPALGGKTYFGHNFMVTNWKREKTPTLQWNVFSADKKLCVFLVNGTEVHYNRNVKGFRKLELRVESMHPL